jgi:hypothetical protein
MKCQTASKKYSASLDKCLPAEELRELKLHFDECPECALRFHQTVQVKNTLGHLPVRVAPRKLTTRLQILASRERLVQRRHASFGAVWRHWSEDVRFWAHNLMGSAALPFAGGLASAVFLFSMLVPTFALHQRSSVEDIPTGLTTEAGLVSSMTFGLTDDDIVVDVLVDEQGRMVDYTIPPGQKLDPTLRRSVENTLLCTRFSPATMFGQPASGKLRITLRRSEVEVRG